MTQILLLFSFHEHMLLDRCNNSGNTSVLCNVILSWLVPFFYFQIFPSFLLITDASPLHIFMSF